MVKLKSGIKIRSGIKILVPDNDMILVYAIPDPSTNIQLAIKANSTWFSAGQSVVIDWGDGSAAETVSATSSQSGYIGHKYADKGTYTIKISGSMKMYGRGVYAEALNGQLLLTHIHSFGELGITSFAFAFNGCSGIVSVPKTVPSEVTNMAYMFDGCSGDGFNPDVSKWDVSNVKDMTSMFGDCYGDAFNPDVSNWDVSKVKSMNYMFYGCSGAAFNPDVSNWDVRNVTNMYQMFYNCSNPNFRGGRGADGLGIGIANWTPKSLSTSGTTGLSDFMAGARSQDATYLDSILNAWAALIGDIVNPLSTGITCHFGTTKYTSAGAASHAKLTASTSSGGAAWTINSGGLQV